MNSSNHDLIIDNKDDNRLPILNITTDEPLPIQLTYEKTKFQLFLNQFKRLLCGRNTNPAKFGVILRYLIITCSMTMFTFVLLTIFRYTCDSSNGNTCDGNSVIQPQNITSSSSIASTETIIPQQSTDTAAVVVQLIWALSPFSAFLFICFGSYKHIHAPISKSIIHDDDTEMNDRFQMNICYSIWNWKMRLCYHFHTCLRDFSNGSPSISSATIVPLSSSEDDLHSLSISSAASPSSSSLCLSSSSLSEIYSQRAPLILPRFPHHRIFNRFNHEDHYPFLFISWFIISLFTISFVSCLQYVLSIIMYASSAISSSFLLKIQSIFPSVSSPSALIITSFIYTFIFGSMWDLFPPVAVDWGVGMGFSGCSWILLSFIEEIGWMMLLFPALLNYNNCLYRSSIYCGIIWSLWHYPAVLMRHYDVIPEGTGYTIGDEATPILYGLITFTLSTIALRIIIIHVSLTTSTLYSAVIIHSLHNVFSISFFAQLASQTSSLYVYMIAECGFPLLIMYVSMATYILYEWKKTYVMIDENRDEKTTRRTEYVRVTSKTGLIQLM